MEPTLVICHNVNGDHQLGYALSSLLHNHRALFFSFASAGRVPGLAPPRAGRRVLAARPPPPRSGVGGRMDAEGARRPSPSWWPGPGGVEEGERRVARRPPPPAAPPRPSPSCLPRGGGGAPRPSRTRGRVARSGILAAGGTGAVGSPGPSSALPDPSLPASSPHGGLRPGSRLFPPPPPARPAPRRRARFPLPG